MKIAIFTDTYLPQVNGVTHTLNKFTEYLSANNHEYRIFAPEYGGEDEMMAVPSVVRFKSVLFPPYPECRISLPFYSTVNDSLKSFQPDLIHLVTPLGIGMTGMKYGKKHNIPIVASFHTNFDTYLKYYKMEIFEELLWKCFVNFHNQCLVNFAPSYDTCDTLRKKGIQNVKLWTRGIDTSRFSPDYRETDFFDKFRCEKNNKPAKEPIRFLYTGRVSLEKDLDILLASAHNINKKYKEQIEFVIVGDGPFKKQMMEEAPENMVFTGYLKDDDLAKAYASCDVFAFPSGTETLGNVVLEAMASGLPVIAVNSGGVKDNVHPGLNGEMVEPRDIPSFAFAIEKLLLSHELRNHYRSNAINYVSTRTWDAIFNQLVADYEGVYGNMLPAAL